MSKKILILILLLLNTFAFASELPKIELISPDQNSEISKAMPLLVKVKLIESTGELVDSNNINFIEAKFQNELKWNLLKSIDLNKTLYEGKLNTKPSYNDTETLLIRASIKTLNESKIIETEKKIDFLKAKINAIISFLPPDTYLNSKIQLARVELYYLNGEPVKNAKIKAKLETLEINLKEKQGFYETEDLGYLIEKEKILFEIIEAKDEFDNSLTNFKKEFQIEGLDKTFKIIFIKPKNLSKVAPGQKILIELKLNSEVEINPSEVSINILNNDGLKIGEFTFNEQSKVFFYEYEIPTTQKEGDELTLKINASINANEIKKTTTNSLNLFISNEYKIEIIDTKQDKIEIKIFYPDNETVITENDVDANLKISEKEYSINFSKVNNLFIAKLPDNTAEGFQNINMVLGKKYNFANATKKVNITRNGKQNYLQIGIAAIILLVLGVVIFSYLTTKKKSLKELNVNQLKKLKNNLSEELVKLEINHNKNKINFKEFKSKWSELEKQIQKVNTNITLKQEKKTEYKNTGINSMEELEKEIKSRKAILENETPLNEIIKGNRIDILKSLIKKKN